MRSTFKPSATLWTTPYFLAFVAAYLIYFAVMLHRGVGYWFSEDDLLNINYAVGHGPAFLAKGALYLQPDTYRPVPELLLYSLYRVFGLHSPGFNIVRIVLCVLDLIVLAWFSYRLTKSREAVIYTMVLMGFHPALFSLYFDGGMLFDLLSFLFFYAGLSYYLLCRDGGRLPGLASSAIVIACCVAALDSKEIAVSFPVALVLMETLLFRSEPFHWRRLVLPLATGLVTLAFIIRLTSGPGALSAVEGYRPHPSLQTYVDTYSNYLGQMIFQPPAVFQHFLIGMLIACLVLALLLRSEVLIWAAAFNCVSILPIAFIHPRNAFAFYVPLVGWAVFAACFVATVRSLLPRGRAPLAAFNEILVVTVLCAATILPEARIMRTIRGPACDADGLRNKPYYDELRSLLPADLSQKKVLALRQPFHLSWAFSFLVHLAWKDQPITVDTADLLKERGAPVIPAPYDFVVDFQDGHFKLVASPAIGRL